VNSEAGFFFLSRLCGTPIAIVGARADRCGSAGGGQAAGLRGAEKVERARSPTIDERILPDAYGCGCYSKGVMRSIPRYSAYRAADSYYEADDSRSSRFGEKAGASFWKKRRRNRSILAGSRNRGGRRG